MTLQGAGGPGAHGHYPAPTVKTSTKGPKILTVAGIGCLAIVIAIVCVVVFAFTWNQSVLSTNGSPGPTVTLAVDAPGEGLAEVTTTDRQRVYLTYPTGDPAPGLDGEIVVHAPTGQTVEVLVPDGGSEVSEGGTTAHLIGLFDPTAPGEYRIEVPATADGSAATVLIQPTTSDYEGFGQVVFAVIAIPVAIFLGAVGVVMSICGGIWWNRRAVARRHLSGGGSGRHP
ncbi:hypothetical protein [Occultella gossypii]|uniref:Uncharacterized protein n=1 Tax=Occultella gossypii TaxID=2800820 RepID=A0ABS7SDG0_9MICO|nr:hypothetical protein [Occultella gossypii]MBZ2198393.1 hypothetical protein [Occultella gossypii]